MISDAVTAAEQILSRPFRAVLWKTLGMTVVVLVGLWAASEKLVVTFVHPSQAWLATSIHVLAGLGLIVGVAFLVTPVSFAVASFFFDQLADHVEDGLGTRGRAMPFGPALWVGVKFAGVALFVNLAALLLLLVPGVNLVAFFGANAYLLGRGFFELAALRHMPIEAVRALRREHGVRIFVAGCFPAALSLVPVANILTPLFASALMVRVAHQVIRRSLVQPSP